MTSREEATIDAAFAQFHKRNRWIADRLEQMCAARIAVNPSRRVSVKLLIEVLRYLVEADPVHAGPFKIDNRFSSRYARLLLERHPEWASLIETRALRAA